MDIRSIESLNITFVPQSIYITIDDLPAPNSNASVTKQPQIVPVPVDPQLYVPDGFTVQLYMDNLTKPRYLIYTPTDDILVSEPEINRISCLVDNDRDGFPDQRFTFANESNALNYPYSMAFANGYFYVASKDAVRRYAWSSGDLQITGLGEVLMSYSADGRHQTRTIVISPAGDRMFLGTGSATNVDPDPLPKASLQQANLDGKNQTTFASGLRNPIGLAFHPMTNDFYVTCQERDEIGDDLVPDYFTRVQQNDFYGWPYAYLSSNLTDPRRQFSNRTSERPDLVQLTKTPDVLFQAHSAVFSLQFYTARQFPARYRNGAFAAFRGSWNRNNGTGYKIVFIPFNSTTNRPMGYYEDFIRGFLTNPSGPDTFGRPVGVLIMKDGSLLFSEDGNNRIYKVQYNQNTNSTTDGNTTTSTTTTMTTTSTSTSTETSTTTTTTATTTSTTTSVPTSTLATVVRATTTRRSSACTFSSSLIISLTSFLSFLVLRSLMY